MCLFGHPHQEDIAKMAKANKKEVSLNLNPNWQVSEEYKHGKDTIAYGDKIKIKFERGEFKFIRHVYHTTRDVEWIDCVSAEGFRSFYVASLKGKVKPRKIRVKKNV